MLQCCEFIALARVAFTHPFPPRLVVITVDEAYIRPIMVGRPKLYPQETEAVAEEFKEAHPDPKNRWRQLGNDIYAHKSVAKIV